MLFVSFLFFALKITKCVFFTFNLQLYNHSIQKIRINIQKASPRIRSLRYFIIMRDIRKRVLPKFMKLCVWRHHVGVPLRGTHMAAGNKQKPLLLSFPNIQYLAEGPRAHRSPIGIMGRDRKWKPVDARKFGYDVSVHPNDRPYGL